MRMTVLGWVFLVSAWGIIIATFGWCMWRIMAPRRKR
jgi:hypothetical protein